MAIDIDKYINKLERVPGKKQEGYIRVMSKIVKDLSSGIYSSPANCIKEIINNSFDANATKVTVRAKPSINLFSVTDNGVGMNLEEFRDQFSVISKSFKRESSDITEEFNRPIIGKIGIGFIAVSEICDKLTIITKKKGDKGRIVAEIDFKKFKKNDIDSNDEFYKKSSFILEYQEVPNEKDKQYTKVLLSELTKDFKEILLDKDAVSVEPINDELEGKTFEDVIQFFRNKEISTYEELGEYWKLILDIAQTVPVQYMKNSPIMMGDKDKTIERIRKDLESYNFDVDFDGMLLKKPICFPTEDKFKEYETEYIVHSFKESMEIDGKKLSFRGYFYSQHGTIYPKTDTGVLIRIRNVKIGGIDSEYLKYSFVSNMVFRHWNFGEIYVDEGLEEAMNIDRNSFRLTHAHYRAIKKFVHKYLDDVVFPYCLNGFYWAKRKRKEKEREKEQKRKIEKAVQYVTGSKKKFNIKIDNKKKEEAIFIDKIKSEVTIHPKSKTFYSFNKKEKIILQEVLVIFETVFEKVMKNNEGIEKLKEYFYEALKNREK